MMVPEKMKLSCIMTDICARRECRFTSRTSWPSILTAPLSTS